jgi:TRAP transporter 4TM/12TM fusion protein
MINNKTTIFMEKVIYIIALGMGVFQIYNSLFRNLEPLRLQNFHLMFALVLIFLNSIKGYVSGKKKGWTVVLPFLGLTGSLLSTLYVNFKYDEMVMHVGRSTTVELIIGAILLVVILLATKESFGIAIPILIVIGIIYMFTGPYLPGIFYHGGFNIKRVIASLITSFSGAYGNLLNTSATYIALFMILGGFMNKTGAGNFFVQLALSIGGRFRAGPGLTAIAASGLMGSINGSAVAVVATTGVFTLPLMKDRGYKPEFAAAVCSVASTGGMILPPVMGVGAFIMAELTGNTYATVAISALVPALLYYLMAAAVVIVRTRKMGLQPIPKEELPKVIPTLKEGAAFLLPLFSIVYCLAVGYSTTMAALYAIAILIGVYLVMSLVKSPSSMLKASTYKPLIDGLADGALSCIGVAVTMAAVGILNNCVVSTGLANRLVSVILRLGNEGAIVSLIITMLLTLLFGMGVPTTAAYIILAMMAAPSLVRIGLPVLPVHLFIFYFATIANLTPPVAPATIIAGRMADANYVKACGHAMKMCFSSFIIPFIFVLRPAMLLQGDLIEILDVVGTAFLGLLAFAFLVEQYVFTKTRVFEQVLLAVATVCLLLPLQWYFSLTGIICLVSVILSQRTRVSHLKTT